MSGSGLATATAPRGSAYTPTSTRSAFDCPKCGASTTRKLSLVHEAGSSTIATGTVGAGYAFGGGAGIGAAKTQGVQVTALAERVAPPQPRNPLWWLIALLVGVGLMSADNVFLGMLIGGAGVFGFWKVRQYNTEEHPHLLDQWRRSSLCDRCGEIFVL